MSDKQHPVHVTHADATNLINGLLLLAKNAQDTIHAGASLFNLKGKLEAALHAFADITADVPPQGREATDEEVDEICKQAGKSKKKKK